MGFNIHSFEIIRPRLHGDVLSLGYPSIDLAPEEYEAALGFIPETFVETPAYFKHPQTQPDGREVFKRLGVALKCLDQKSFYGDEIIADLNYPCDVGQFDMVLDGGTVEHCFNIGQAFANILRACKVGGCIFHGSPLSMMNHGYFNLNPCLFVDFYNANGCKVLFMQARTDRGTGDVLLMNVEADFPGVDKAALYCLVKKKKEVPLVYPVQVKYR